MQVRARPVWVGFRLGFATHALQVEVFQRDEVVFTDEHAGGLVLPVVYDSVGLRVQSADFPTGTLVGAARIATVFPHRLARHVDPSRLSLLTAAYFTVDPLPNRCLGRSRKRLSDVASVCAQPLSNPTMAPVRSRPIQRVVDEHERASCPVHPDARIVADGLADADADIDAVPARLAVQTIFAGVLAGYHDLAVMPVQPPVVRRPLIVPADEIQVVMTGLNRGIMPGFLCFLLQRSAALVRGSPVRVLYPVRGLQNHRGHGRKP